MSKNSSDNQKTIATDYEQGWHDAVLNCKTAVSTASSLAAAKRELSHLYEIWCRKNCDN